VIDDFAVHLATALANDKTAGYQPALFQRIVMAFIDTDGSEWSRIKDVLRERGVFQDYLKRIKKRAHELEGVVEIGGATQGERTIKDHWSDAPVADECVPPAGWGLNDPKLAVFRLEQKTVDGQRLMRRVAVSYDPVVISRRIQHKETGVIYCELSWRSGSKWHSYVFERDAIFSTRKIVDCAKYGAPVGSDNAAELVQYLRAYENENRRSIPPGYAQSCMGWLGDEDDLGHHGFLVGSRQIGGNGKKVEFVGDAGADFKQGGDFEAWKAAIARMDPWPAMRVAICACLAAPLVGIVGAPNTIIEFCGDTSGGKSIALRTGFSCWRSAKAKLPRWNATANGLEARAQVLNDLPLVVDDTADIPDSKRRDLLGQSVYMLESGHTRTRSSKTLQQAPAKQWRTVVLSSGEYSLADYVGTGGAAARVLSFWGAPLGEVASEQTGTTVAEVMVELGQNYGHAGPRFVQWLCDNRERWFDFAKDYRTRVSKLRALLGSRVAMRLAETIALLAMTSDLANEALGLGWNNRELLADPYIAAAIERALQSAQVSSNKAREAWEHVMSVAESRRSQWAVWGDTPSAKEEPHGGWLGWKRIGDPGESGLRDIEGDDGAELLAWFPSQLKRVLQDAGYMPDVILKAWREHRVLLTSSGRLTYTTKCGGGEKMQRIYLVKANKTTW
jgi:putative DNA primase/helicase